MTRGVLTHPNRLIDNRLGLSSQMCAEILVSQGSGTAPQRFPGPAHPSPHARRLPCPKDAGEHASS